MKNPSVQILFKAYFQHSKIFIFVYNVAAWEKQYMHLYKQQLSFEIQPFIFSLSIFTLSFLFFLG